MQSERRHRVLVVDDSAVARRMIVEALAGEPKIQVVGAANNGRAAVEVLDELDPDLVTLDVEMPELDGLGALRELRLRRPQLPVVMFSTRTTKGAQTTVAALLAGANDFVHKPSGRSGPDDARQEIRTLLVPKILALCESAARARSAPLTASTLVSRRSLPGQRGLFETTVFANPAALGAPGARPRVTDPIEVVAIGISTGGPAALAELLSALGPDLPVPLLIVQHMPATFTRHMAESLARRSRLEVREAQSGELLRKGTCLIAPGDHHMLVEPAAGGARIALNQAEPVNSCRPAVDVLFRSMAPLFKSRSLALVMTGMGQDGLAGARELRACGGTILAQDEASSVVWGMPGSVVREGLAERVLDVAGLAAEIRRRTRSARIAPTS